MTEEEHKQRRRESQKRWVAAHPDYFRVYRRRYHAEAMAVNPEYRRKRRENNRRWYSRNRAAASAATKRWRANNRDHVLAYYRVYNAANSRRHRVRTSR